ncbi:hypothetical protein CB1_000520003 [Camelus ferus]|nr:hypothetical protein CB1_000520003 [Camelus ferus]
MMLLAPTVHAFAYHILIAVASTVSDVQPSLFHCDTRSAAQEALYLPDISFSSQLRSAPLLIADQGPVELPEEFVVQVPKEPRSQPKPLRPLAVADVCT